MRHAETEHFRVGKTAAEKGLFVISVGEGAEKIHEGATSIDNEALHFKDVDGSAAWMKENCKEGDCVLFKGSRMAGMEKAMNQAFPEN